MKVKYISPIQQQSPLLFPFPNMEEVDSVKDASVIFFDLHSRKYDYDEKVLQQVIGDKNKPVICFDFWDYNCFDNEESEYLWKDNWTPLKRYKTQWADFIKMLLVQNRPVIWFVRKLDNLQSWDRTPFYPIELIMYPDHVFEPVTPDELFNRPYDVFFAGNESPSRRSVYEGLKDSGLKIDWHWSNEKGKLPHDEWIERSRQSKLFLSADGGGYNDERIYQLAYCGVILKQKNNQLIFNNFTQGFNCLKVSETPLEKEVEFIKIILSNKERLHKIYLEGIKNIERYYNANYRSAYILNVLYTNNIN